MIKYLEDIENGTVPSGLTSSAEFAFPINMSNVVEELPGSTSSTNLDMGISIVSMDLENLVLVLDGHWVNRRLLQIDNQIVIRRDFLNKKFNCVKVYMSDQKGNYRETLRENNDALEKLVWEPKDRLQEYINQL